MMRRIRGLGGFQPSNSIDSFNHNTPGFLADRNAGLRHDKRIVPMMQIQLLRTQLSLKFCVTGDRRFIDLGSIGDAQERSATNLFLNG
ncbi:hypothetical protein ASC90_20850 [Rhizobium sp. Root1220]|nr:hypothetical protein ASC90_20850 [Rhizobium sp. Root1220]